MPAWFTATRDLFALVGVGWIVFYLGSLNAAVRSLSASVNDHTRLDEQRFSDVRRALGEQGKEIGAIKERVGMVKQAVADVESELERGT